MRVYRIFKYETAMCSGSVNDYEIPKSGTTAPTPFVCKICA